MDASWRRPHGMRLTLRHTMIVVLYFALLFALIIPLLRGGLYASLGFLLPLSPPLLALRTSDRAVHWCWRNTL